ncbi:MAG TPA: T9SS type A sorting domain-containing protein [Candidatus Marinimicrobia bacterium]|nr:T9SS type A sorting domain-containing protein [Candidatus Neomarinimicrobiota bacterium]
MAEHWYEPIKFTFNKEIDFGTLQEGFFFSSRHGVYEDLETEYDAINYVLIIYNPGGWFNGDTLDIEITTGVKDIYGNPFDGNGNDDPDSTGDNILYTVSIGLLGDYDESDLIDFDDLITFQQLWFSDTLQTIDEIGPTEGTPPYLRIIPDSKFDFEDLMVFVQMWNWSAGFNYGGNLLAKSTKTSNEDLSLYISYSSKENENFNFNVHLNVSDFINVGALELTVQYDTTDIIFNKAVSYVDESWIMLNNVNSEEGKLVINLVDLNQDARVIAGKPFTLSFAGKKDTETDILWQADVRNRSGLIKYQTSEKFTFNTTAPIPQTYTLHQNYPNPFNPSTTIRYDLPEAAQVHLVIYNILGQEVVSLVNKQESAGFHSIIWNSKNQYGKTVSPGIYFYLLKTDRYIATKKLVLLK